MVNTKKKIVLPENILREIQECIKNGEILNYNKYYKLFISKEGSTYCSYNTFRTHLKELRVSLPLAFLKNKKIKLCTMIFTK